MTQLTLPMINAMLELQDSMNTKVNPQWKYANYPFLRAIVIEGAEAMEHHGWKWWKKQDMDKAQLQIELVDIWHFALSHYILLSNGKHDVAAADILAQAQSEYYQIGCSFYGRDYEYKKMGILEKLELMIGLAVARKFFVPLFESLMHDVDMNWDELYRQYVGKNVLNFFRQDHGYKEGTYHKIWNGQEDNVFLANAMNQLDTASADFPSLLYQTLKAGYSALVPQ